MNSRASQVLLDPLKLTKIRDLDLRVEDAKIWDTNHLSAASGLVQVGESLFVVADDELGLGVFPARGRRGGKMHRLIPGTLPDRKKRRKQAKPDFEALLLLPASRTKYPMDRLMAIPSGSMSERTRGACVSLTRTGSLKSVVSILDFRPLYEKLWREFPELNIEGEVFSGEDLVLLQRGNGRSECNALIRLNWSRIQRNLEAEDPIGASAIRSIKQIKLGNLHGIPLGFTDATASDLTEDRVIFIASAEAGKDTIRDGECAGSIIGIIHARTGKIERTWELSGKFKAEGISARQFGKWAEVRVVTDPDDRSLPAELFSTRIELSK